MPTQKIREPLIKQKQKWVCLFLINSLFMAHYIIY